MHKLPAIVSNDADFVSCFKEAMTQLPLLKDLVIKKLRGKEEKIQNDPEETVELLKIEIKEMADKVSTTRVRGAVIGNSGAGKSTLINSFIDKDSEEEGAAKVGEIETTHEVITYHHKANPLIEIDDLPGTGTSSHPIKSYVNDFQLKKYAFIIIVLKDRVTENDLVLAQEIMKHNVPLFVVRSRLDIDIDSAFKRSPKLRQFPKICTEEEQTQKEEIQEKIKMEKMDEIKQNILKEATKTGISIDPRRIYLTGTSEMQRGVSFIYRQQFEFDTLLADIAESLPDVQREVLAKNIMLVSKKWLDVKVGVLKKYIWIYAASSAVGALVPFLV